MKLIKLQSCVLWHYTECPKLNVQDILYTDKQRGIGFTLYSTIGIAQLQNYGLEEKTVSQICVKVAFNVIIAN